MGGEKKILAMEKRNCVFSRCHTFSFLIAFHPLMKC